MVGTLILDLLPKFSERLMKKVAARQIRKDKDQEGKNNKEEEQTVQDT